jgi:predicted nucleotidyltransferase
MVLEHFIWHSDSETCIKGLARKLKISSMTAKQYCDLLEEGGMLEAERKGLAKFFRLRNKDPVVKMWKKAVMLQKIRDCGVEGAINNPFYIYGSSASGEFTEKSDIDIFIIEIRKFDRDSVERNLRKAGREINIKAVPYNEIGEFKKKSREFADGVRKGVLFGDEAYGL